MTHGWKRNTYRHILLYSRWYFQLTVPKSHFIHGPSASFVSQWESVQVFGFSDVPLSSKKSIRWSRTLQVFEHNWAPRKYSESHPMFPGCFKKEIPIGRRPTLVTHSCWKKNAKGTLVVQDLLLCVGDQMHLLAPAMIIKMMELSIFSQPKSV